MSNHIKPYEFRVEGKGGNKHIYALFRDHYFHLREVEITEDIYLELVASNRSIRNIEISEERHKEYRNFTEEERVQHGACSTLSAEEEVLVNERAEELRQAFAKLPAIQARRYLLAHQYGYSYLEISYIEGCSANAIKKSLVAAKRNLQEILRNRVPDDPSECGSK